MIGLPPPPPLCAWPRRRWLIYVDRTDGLEPYLHVYPHTTEHVIQLWCCFEPRGRLQCFVRPRWCFIFEYFLRKVNYSKHPKTRLRVGGGVVLSGKGACSVTEGCLLRNMLVYYYWLMSIYPALCLCVSDLTRHIQ